MITPNSGGRPERPGFNMKPQATGGPAYGGAGTGEVVISAAEAKVLRALEFTDGPDALMVASRESGMPVDRVQELKRRADAARSKGFTLKGPNIKLGPINAGVPEDGLLGPDEDGDGTPDSLGMDDALFSDADRPGGGPASPRTAVAGHPGGVVGPLAALEDTDASPPAPSMDRMASTGLSRGKYAPPSRPPMSQVARTPPSAAVVPHGTPMDRLPAHRPTMGQDRTTARRTPKTAPPAGKRGSAPSRPGGLAGSQRDARDPRLAQAYSKARESNLRECDGATGCPCQKHKKMRDTREQMALMQRRRRLRQQP